MRKLIQQSLEFKVELIGKKTEEVNYRETEEVNYGVRVSQYQIEE